MNIIETTTQKDYYGNDITKKKIKDGFFKDSHVISTSQSELAKSEKNDCVNRNVEHLELMVAKSDWGSEDMAAANSAITAGKSYVA